MSAGFTPAQEERLRTTAAEFGAPLDDRQVALLARMTALLMEWNARFNLTAIRTVDEILDKHILDSLGGHRHFGAQDFILDVGTGAGFPGLVLKIAGPDRRLLLIDGTGKKITYVQAVIRELGLERIAAMQQRAEDPAFRMGLRESLDAVTARAVAKADELVRLGEPYLKPGGRLVLYKGPAEADAIAAARYPGFEPPSVHAYRLPAGDERALAVLTRSSR